MKGMALAQERGAALLTPPEDAPTLTPYAGKRRLDYIDTLRGLAALWVVFYHYSSAHRHSMDSTNPVTAFAVTMISYGQLGVNLFLVVSGFCLFYPLARKAFTAGDGNGPLSVSFWPFMARRARRILPPYWALLTVQTLVMLLWFRLGPAAPEWIRIAYFIKKGDGIDYRDVAAHFLLVHNLLARYIGSMAVPFWSIALEWQLYLVFPLLVLFRNRWGIWRVLAFACLLSASWQIGYYWMNPDLKTDNAVSWGYGARALWSLPSRLFEFVAGMAAAYVVARGDLMQGKRAAVSLLVLLPLGLYLFPRTPNTGLGPLINVLWGGIFALILVSLDYATRLRPDCLRFFWPLTHVGLFSYSLYLVHEPILIASGAYLQAHVDVSMSQRLLWIVVVALPINLAYAYFWHYLFERPVLNASKGRKET